MELIGLLSKVVKENITTKKILLEYPESTIKRLLDKFSQSTDDTEEQIRKVIADFERFKGGFATNEKNEVKQLNDELKNLDPSSEEYKDLQIRIRDLNKTIQDMLDIFKYDYDSLKNLTSEKETKQKTKKTFEGTVQDYIKKYKGTDLQLTKVNIRKFFEMLSQFSKAKELRVSLKPNVLDYTPSELNTLVSKYFSRFNNNGVNELIIAIAQNFQKQIPDEDVMTTVLPRAKRYVQHYNLIPMTTKLSAYMTFDEFEHVVDAYTPMEESEYTVPDIDLGDVDIAYEDDDVLIFAPDEKHKCINIRKKFAPDRRWCTSWEGSSNYYYNYRLNQNLTLYYIINKNLPESNLDYASVVLVDRYGEMRLADGSNSGRYAGSTVIPWSEITKKVPVLKGKESYLKAKPYSDEDMQKMQRFKSYNLTTTDPVAELGGEQQVELWLELRSPDLKSTRNGDEIFGNLPEELQRKYIGLGNELTAGMVRVLSPSVLTYYVSKKKEKLLQKQLKDLSENDMEVILSEEMKPYIKDLKKKYYKEIDSNMSAGLVQIQYPSDVNAKYAKMFGLEELFELIPEDVRFLTIENKSNDSLILKIPESIGKFKNMLTFSVEKCVNKIPEAIGECSSLSFLNVTNNVELTTLPESLLNCYCLEFISVEGSKNLKINNVPKNLAKYLRVGDILWEPDFPDEIRDKCESGGLAF